MNPIPFEPGRVVTSKQGRDKDRHFVVIQVEGEYVLMADGLTRKLDHLKKKKTKHLKPRPALMGELEKGGSGGPLMDSDLRTFLEKNGFGNGQPLCKED